MAALELSGGGVLPNLVRDRFEVMGVDEGGGHQVGIAEECERQ